MARRTRVNRLRLGPIVGHTDDSSTRIWIQVGDDPSLYDLRIRGWGTTPFGPTEAGEVEFRTGIAVAEGLRPGWEYRYQVLRRGRVVPGGFGRFRTMPPPGSFAGVTFVVASCSHQQDVGAWAQLADFVERADPRFLVLLGDQVYLDSGGDGNLWDEHLDSKPQARRRAMVAKYRGNWSREPVRRVLANVPTYMVWDDHEIRDGWGSLAPDSPTMATLFPDGAAVAATYSAYFEDARDLYWHFQMCRNPLAGSGQGVPNYIDQPPGPGQRRAMPFGFRCGRVVVLVLDSRGERDLWRADSPVLGADQWSFVDTAVAGLESDVDALVLVTPVPIASVSPTGQMQFLLGSRTDDVELFARGDADGLRGLMTGMTDADTDLEAAGDLAGAALSGWLAARFGMSTNLGGFRLADIDDVRDQWSHAFSRPEQERLIRAAGAARLTNRLAASPRAVAFVGGDLHVGGIFDIAVEDAAGGFQLPCLVSSGISKQAGSSLLVGTLVDDEFEVAAGITSSLRTLVNEYNFGVVEVVPTGGTPVLNVAVAHAGSTSVEGAAVSFAI